jgi:GntP family gluconate:H+ symporter
MSPFVILAVGVAVVLVLILWLRINAFLALLTAAVVVSLMSPGALDTKIARVAEAFGNTAAAVGIVIALAAIIGACLLESGAADRIVKAFMNAIGVERSPIALLSSGYVLAIPVFFDTVFYLLVPLARSFYRSTGKNYLKCLLAIAAGGAITHTLVPPTPGPLTMAANLDIDLGVMMGVGALIGLPAAVAGLLFGAWADRRMPVTPGGDGIGEVPDALPGGPDTSTSQAADVPPVDPAADPAAVPAGVPAKNDMPLPSLGMSLLPVLLPVFMIALHTTFGTLRGRAEDRVAALADADPAALADAQGTLDAYSSITSYTAVLGNPNLALLVSTAIALYLLAVQRRPTREQTSRLIETSLMSAGVIILITCAGSAFGAMLKLAGLKEAIEGLFGDAATSGLGLLVLAFGMSALLKACQGSSTAAMVVTSELMAGFVLGEDAAALTFHPVYLGTAIGGGALVGSWMNDSGFWIFAKMGGLTEAETLKSWTPLLTILGVTSFLSSLLLAWAMPLV